VRPRQAGWARVLLRGRAARRGSPRSPQIICTGTPRRRASIRSLADLLAATAVEWLLDNDDPRWRLDPIYRNHPAVLALATHARVHALVGAARRQWGELGEYVPAGCPRMLPPAPELYSSARDRCSATAAAVDLVREALRSALDSQALGVWWSARWSATALVRAQVHVRPGQRVGRQGIEP